MGKLGIINYDIINLEIHTSLSNIAIIITSRLRLSIIVNNKTLIISYSNDTVTSQ